MSIYYLNPALVAVFIAAYAVHTRGQKSGRSEAYRIMSEQVIQASQITRTLAEQRESTKRWIGAGTAKQPNPRSKHERRKEKVRR
jgi:hypothetical protein